ncbi:MAG: hypothetical protein KC731_14005 [Myxococcales bacterium]|nr:hypothetical protein [Myxococcales bacterium]
MAISGAAACGPSAEWEPAVVPPSTQVPPPLVPGEGKASNSDEAFFDDEPAEPKEEPSGEAAPPSSEPSGKPSEPPSAPAPEGSAPAPQ